jgi:hypothetical protein
MLGAGRLVLVAFGLRMGEVTFLSQMYGVLKELAHTRDERPKKQCRDSDCCETLHSE